jgi:hypothetical protein
VDEREWRRLTDQLRNGDCTPFLGAGACAGTLPVGAELSKSWADEYEYPFPDSANELPRVMHYASIMEGDPVHLKRLVARRFFGQGPPDFTNSVEPHGLLAKLPLNVYVTTNYDDFMLKALSTVGKKPQAIICPWYLGAASTADSGAPPTAENPIVYHMHGSFADPSTLVLTEADYLEFLINFATSQRSPEQRIIPTAILPALTRRPLLFIGYSLQDWTFRVLFHGLLRTVAPVQQRRHVSVQLPVPKRSDDMRAADRAKHYLTRYFEDWKISVFWGTTAEFCTELRERLDAA